MSDTFQAGRITFVAQQALSELVGRLQQGLPLAPWYADPAKAQAISDLAGALNAWAAAPVPPPSSDPLARILAAPSQWAKWCGMSDAEAQALIDRGYITRDQKDTLNNWWFTFGVKGQRLPDGRYQYATYETGVEILHIDTGGADAATEQASGKRIPGPALP